MLYVKKGDGELNMYNPDPVVVGPKQKPHLRSKTASLSDAPMSQQPGVDDVHRDNAHLVRDSCSDSNIFCLLSSSINVTVTSFSRSLDSAVAIGGVTPK